jgi:hypothetical protein
MLKFCEGERAEILLLTVCPEEPVFETSGKLSTDMSPWNKYKNSA